MAIIKCKSCGGNLVLDAEQNTGTCEYCGIVQTITKYVDDEHKISLFNRGNDLRRRFEFDRAIAQFEKVVEMDETDAEAHWCLALSRHGIEYVDSPNDGRRVPTCHRLNAETILNDYDYQQAFEHASLLTRHLYQEQAQEIAEIQKRIFAISQRETPFDVFICFKDTDDTTGQRTQDSVDAQDIYYQLTDLGYKVFFSRITLETKGGEEYEPYIFSALHSAKVMIVVGSKKEYYEAVWVRNEWSRYLNLIREEKQHNGYSTRRLIPCYRNIEAYDIPDELNLLQAHNMSKIGFVQDLIHGIKKVIGDKSTTAMEQETTVKTPPPTNDTRPVQNTATVASLLDRATIYLEDQNWESVKKYCERVLDLEPRNGQAYYLWMLAGYKVAKLDDLLDTQYDVDNNGNFKKALRFGDNALKIQLEQFIERKKQHDNQRIYQQAIHYKEMAHYATGSEEENYSKAIELFRSIAEYSDSNKQLSVCQELLTDYRLRRCYEEAVKFKRLAETTDPEINYVNAIRFFEAADGYSDAKMQLEHCKDLRDDFIYQKACDLKALADKGVDSAKNYVAAKEVFVTISHYKDAAQVADECIKASAYTIGLNYMQEANKSKSPDLAQKAAEQFALAGNYKNAGALAIQCESLSSRFAELQQCYFQLEHEIKRIGNTVSGSKENTNKLIRMWNDFSKLSGYRDSDSLKQNFRDTVAEYMVYRQVTLRSNRQQLLNSNKKVNLDTVRDYEKELEIIQTFRTNNADIEAKFKDIANTQMQQLTGSQSIGSVHYSPISQTSSTPKSKGPDRGSFERQEQIGKILAGVGIVVGAIIFFALF